MNWFYVKAFFAGRIQPLPYCRRVEIDIVRKQQKQGVRPANRRCSFEAMHISHAQQQKRRKDRDAYVHLPFFHDWPAIAAQTSGSSSFGCAKRARSDCHTASSNTFHEPLPRRESDCEVQQAADFLSPSFAAASAIRPHA